MKKILILALLPILVLYACKKENYKNNSDSQKTHINQELKLKIYFTTSSEKKVFKRGQKIDLLVKIKSDTVDSILLYINDSLVTKAFKTTNFSYAWNSANAKHVGKQYLKLKVFKNGKQKSAILVVTLLSDKKPEHYTYKIIKTFPHDPYAYTQGLVYQDGILYEATGLKGESSIRKVQINSGKVIQSYTVPPDIFGEGITIWNDKIIQLSWKAHRGFIYNKNTFDKLGEFSYPTEGWGLTHDNKNLIMSDGTNKLYFLDPNTFFVVKTIEVYDDKAPVKWLNELEYINGKIYANIYTKDYIAIINPNSGQVEAYLDLSGILPKTDYASNTDVLNGIAYDKQNNRLFVTGKNWPKLFQIQIVKK